MHAFSVTLECWLSAGCDWVAVAAATSGVVRGSRGVTALYHCFLDKITVIPLLSEGNYSIASVTEKSKRYLAHEVLPLAYLTANFRTTSFTAASDSTDCFYLSVTLLTYRNLNLGITMVEIATALFILITIFQQHYK